MNSLISILISILVLLAGAGVGRLARGLWSSKGESAGDARLVDTALGLGILSLVIFFLMLAAGGTTWLCFPVLGAFAAVFAADCVRRGVVFRLPDRTLPRGAAWWIASLLFAFIFWAMLIPALAPPSMADWDSLAYHLAVPKLYLEHGGIHYIDFTSHSNFPFLMEMLYVPGLVLGNPVAAKLTHFWMAVLLIGAVGLLVRMHVNPRGEALAMIAVMGMPILMWEATTAYVDLATALYTVLSVHLLMSYLDSGDRRHLIGCAVSAGLAASTKMTGLALLPMLAAWLLIDRFAAERRIEWKRALMFAAVALLVCAPWYLKSLIYTGSPVYPFFYSVFGGRDWTAELAANYTMLQKQFGTGHSFGSFMFLPYDLTFRSDLFYDRPGLFVGPIFLVSLPLLFAARYGSRKMVGLLAFFVAQVVVWFQLSEQSRYLIPALAILAALLAGLVYQDERFARARGAFLGVFTATAVFGLLIMYPGVRNTAAVAFGLESRESYLGRTLDIYPAQEYMNSLLPADARVAFFGDTRGYYLDRDYVWADWGHNAAFSRDYASAEDLVRHLRKHGVTHAMVNFGVSFPSRDKAEGTSARVYQAIEEGLFVQVFPDDDFGRAAVYEVK